MKSIFKIFTMFFAGMLLMTSVMAQDCRDDLYKKTHSKECSYSDSTNSYLSILGASGIIGSAIAIMAFTGTGSNNTDTSFHRQTTTINYNMVGNDVTQIQLADAKSTQEYTANYNNYESIRLPYSLARGFTGKGFNIAVLDAGLDTWHGKTVTDLASGIIAPDAKVDSYKIIDQDFNFISFYEIGETIKNANNADIFNASWTSSMRSDQLVSKEQLIKETDINFVNQLISAANRDAIFVWAAGNDYDKRQSGALSAMPKVISELQGHFINVVAWDESTQSLADFSNACGETKNYCITAPGTNININHTIANGTSFAAPMVSAAIAVIKEAFPYMKAQEITSLLLETARDLGAPGIDEIYGHGMLDMERATRPVGAPLIPISYDNSTIMQPLQAARVAGNIASNIKQADIKFAFFDKYGRAFTSNFSDIVKIQNPSRAFDKLRNSNQVIVFSTNNFDFGLKQNDLLNNTGLLKTQPNTFFSFINFNQQQTFNNIKLYQKIQFSYGLPKPQTNSLISDFSNIYSFSASFGAKLFDLDFNISIPDTIIAGNMYMTLPTGRDKNGKIFFNTYDIGLSSKPSIEYSLSYNNLYFGFIDNPIGTDEVYVLAKAKLSF